MWSLFMTTLFKNFLLTYNWLTVLISAIQKSDLHMYAFFMFLSIVVSPGILNLVPLLFIRSECKSLHLLSANSQSSPPANPFPIITTSLFSTPVSLFPFPRQLHLCRVRFHVWVMSTWYFLSLSNLHYFVMIISSCFHVAAHKIISFLLWLSSVPLYICTTSSLSICLPMDI